MTLRSNNRISRRLAELGGLALGLAGIAIGSLHLPADTTAANSNFHTIRTADYILTTDADFATSRRTLETLTTLRQQFLRHFATLIQTGPDPGPGEVIYFCHEADYRAKVLQIAPGLVNSAGLFSPQQNRLLLLDQFGTTDYARAQQILTTSRDRLAGPHEASVRLAALRTTVASEARLFTTRLTRHEGAHQLFHAYGIESAYPVAPTWLTEGLAQYCELDEIGTRDTLLIARVTHARENQSLVPLRVLLNHRESAGFFSLGEEKVATAYAQSWALTYFLMQQPGFHDFIKHYRDVRDEDTAQEVRREDIATTLAQYIGTDYSTLEKQWQEFLVNL